MRMSIVIATALLGLTFACKTDTPSPSEGSNSESGGSTTGEEESTDSNVTETTDEVPACDPADLAMCVSGFYVQLESCFSTCTCDDLDCVGNCHDEYEDNFWACAGEVCPSVGFEYCRSGPVELCPSFHCVDGCDLHQGHCEEAAGCGENMCEYHWLGCTNGCNICNEGTFSYAYEDSCAIVLPGPPSAFHEPYVYIDIGGQGWGVSEMGVGCGDPEASDVVWVDSAQLLLCETACDAFAMSGSAEVVYGIPPCE